MAHSADYHQKRTLLGAETIAHTICQAVPHLQPVFTIPKRLRLDFHPDRRLPGELARAAWERVVKSTATCFATLRVVRESATLLRGMRLRCAAAE